MKVPNERQMLPKLRYRVSLLISQFEDVAPILLYEEKNRGNAPVA